MPDDVIPVDVAAREHGLHRDTIFKWLREGRLQRYRAVGERRTLVSRSELRQLTEPRPADPSRRGAAADQPGHEPPPPTRPKTAQAAAASAPEVKVTVTGSPAKKRDRKDRPVAMAIVVKDGLALMTHRRYKEPAFQWNFVSGEVEPGEPPEEGAIREVREEVGLEVAIEHRLGDRIQPVSKRHMYYFICRVIGGDVDLVDHEENTELAWCTLDEVYEHFEELAQIPDGMYRPLFQYLDRVLAKAPV